MDPRIEKTLEKLRNGLLSLVATEDLTDISISKLAKASGIGVNLGICVSLGINSCNVHGAKLPRSS